MIAQIFPFVKRMFDKFAFFPKQSYAQKKGGLGKPPKPRFAIFYSCPSIFFCGSAISHQNQRKNAPLK